MGSPVPQASDVKPVRSGFPGWSLEWHFCLVPRGCSWHPWGPQHPRCCQWSMFKALGCGPVGLGQGRGPGGADSSGISQQTGSSRPRQAKSTCFHVGPASFPGPSTSRSSLRRSPLRTKRVEPGSCFCVLSCRPAFSIALFLVILIFAGH